MHPLLFIDLALAISPKLKIDVYKWLFDELIKSRNGSGDSYTKMCGALFAHHKDGRTYKRSIKWLANKIRFSCGAKDWQTATEEQLKLRDKIQTNIAELAKIMNNNKEAIRLAFKMNGIEL